MLQFCGCCVSKGALNFSTLEYPTSMSAYLYDQNQDVVMKDRELESIHSFEFKKTFWNLAYGLIPLTKEESISDTLNFLVEKYEGDGIINLTISIEQGFISKLSGLFLFVPSYFPIFPSSTKITISGEVVKLKNPTSSYMFIKAGKVEFISIEQIPLRLYEIINKNNWSRYPDFILVDN